MTKNLLRPIQIYCGMNKLHFLLLAGAGLLLTVVVLCSGYATPAPPSESRFRDVRDLLAPEISQQCNERTYDRSFGEKVSQTNRLTLDQGMVSDIINAGSHIYLADYTYQNISNISTDGDLLRTFSGKGEAPWEHQGLKKLSLRGDSIYTFDYISGSFHTFSVTGEFGRMIQPDYATISSGCMLSEHLAVMTEFTDEYDLKVILYDIRAGREIRSTPICTLLGVTEEVPYPSIALQGLWIPIDQGGAYYVCSKAGLIFRLDQNGEVVFVNSTIDGKQPPEVSLRQKGPYTMFVQEPDYASNLHSAGSGEELIILSNLRFSDGSAKRADVYDGQTGAYLRSLEIPNLADDILPEKIFVGDRNRLFVLYEDQTLATYKRQILMP